MSGYEIKGWCPGALQPMQSGDGLVVRVRPRRGVLSSQQALGLARAAAAHGNGLIDLTSRANVQLRGVTPKSHARLIEDLKALELIDDDVESERRRNIVVEPFRDSRYGRETETLAAALEEALVRGPELPAKFGFAVDTGAAPVLSDVSADVRLERASNGELIVRPDGAAAGSPVAPKEAVREALALATWFVESGGAEGGRGRMARHLASGVSLPRQRSWNVMPSAPVEPPVPGRHDEGFLVAAEFGQLHARALAALAAIGTELRVTPWRMLLVTGATSVPDDPGLIVDSQDPRLRVTACTGAPDCPQALGATRAISRLLAPHVPTGAHLHVSGCAKGCAHPTPAPFTLCATDGGFDLVLDGRPGDAPVRQGISQSLLRKEPRTIFEAR